VTLPSLRFVITIAVLLRTIWTFNWFDLTKLLAGGSNVTNTMILPISCTTEASKASSSVRPPPWRRHVGALALFMYFFRA